MGVNETTGTPIQVTHTLHRTQSSNVRYLVVNTGPLTVHEGVPAEMPARCCICYSNATFGDAVELLISYIIHLDLLGRK